MTVIAWDGRTLAADRQYTYGNTRTQCIKLHKMKNGDVCAVAGAGDTSMAMLEWYRSGAKAETFPRNEVRSGPDEGSPEAELVVARPGHTGLFVYFRFPIPEYLPATRQAFGCGRDFALAALAFGKTARQAVEFACDHDVFCGLGVDSALVNGPAKPKKKGRK